VFRVSFCGTIKRSVWPPRLPNLNARGCYLWGNVQDKIYRNNSRTQDDWKKSNQDVGSSVSPAEIRREMNNAFVRCDAQVRVEGNHLATSLNTASKNLILTTIHCTVTLQRFLYIQWVQYQQQYTEITCTDPDSWQTGEAAIEALVAAIHNGLREVNMDQTNHGSCILKP